MDECARDKWIRTVASENGPASPTTRLVLLVLGSHMDRVGYCYPGTDRLAVESALSKRAVLTHLAKAEDDDWISRQLCGTGRGWKRHAYTATLPSSLQAGDWGGERPAPRQLPGGEAPSPPQPRRGEPDDTDAVNVVHPNLKENLSDKDMSGFDEDAREVLELCNRLRLERRSRKGLSGRPLKATPKRLSKIKARRRDHFSRSELEDAARAFYADSWEGRDRFDDPIYEFKDDATVQAWLDKPRNGPGAGTLADLQVVAGGGP